MNYIISPWIFYLFYLISRISTIAVVIMATGIIILIILFAVYCCDYEDELNKYSSYIKKLIIITCVSTIIAIFLPSEQVMKEMIVASYVTEENVNTASNKVLEIIDYIVDKVDERNGNSN